jgi:hypothetical protein
LVELSPFTGNNSLPLLLSEIMRVGLLNKSVAKFGQIDGSVNQNDAV